MLEVLRYIAYIVLNACLKYCTKDQSNVKGVKGTLYRFQWIKCYVMLCMSKMLKMVFAAFTQHCIQSTDLMFKVSKILWIQWPLDPPSVLDLSGTSLTCFNKHSIWYGCKALSLSFSIFFLWIEKQFNIKKVMSKNVCVCPFPIFDIHSITALRFIWSIFNVFDIDSITFNKNESDISDIFDMSHTLYSVWITM